MLASTNLDLVNTCNIHYPNLIRIQWAQSIWSVNPGFIIASYHVVLIWMFSSIIKFNNNIDNANNNYCILLLIIITIITTGIII